ncbi:predicted protein [Histoplasma capsulatum var. duboisii H88]|uniref:Predicted protein n=1 Tax=Ajellomyces capsulatus (strain H88) TaxID=544711 RepID=F0URH5_AJEC8|nr:predicted protein [Histoplasma capsulatum var. duboisii H88]
MLSMPTTQTPKPCSLQRRTTSPLLGIEVKWSMRVKIRADHPIFSLLKSQGAKSRSSSRRKDFIRMKLFPEYKSKELDNYSFRMQRQSSPVYLRGFDSHLRDTADGMRSSKVTTRHRSARPCVPNRGQTIPTG